jgi:hypothetical protein
VGRNSSRFRSRFRFVSLVRFPKTRHQCKANKNRLFLPTSSFCTGGWKLSTWELRFRWYRNPGSIMVWKPFPSPQLLRKWYIPATTIHCINIHIWRTLFDNVPLLRTVFLSL